MSARTDLVYVTSDLHFNHGGPDGTGGVMRFCNRPYDHVRDMDVDFIEKINALPNKAILWHLGDFYFGNQTRFFEIMDQIKKSIQINFILGNHDKILDKKREEIFKKYQQVREIAHYKELNYNGKKHILFHYPILDWSCIHRDSYHFHGHIHGNNDNHLNIRNIPTYNRLEVTIDTTGYEILHISKLQELAYEQTQRYIKQYGPFVGHY
jgi:calcineurin-like phosphoesterase family protein